MEFLFFLESFSKKIYDILFYKCPMPYGYLELSKYKAKIEENLFGGKWGFICRMLGLPRVTLLYHRRVLMLLVIYSKCSWLRDSHVNTTPQQLQSGHTCSSLATHGKYCTKIICLPPSRCLIVPP